MKHCTSGLAFKQKGKFSNTDLGLNRDFNLNEDQLENSSGASVEELVRTLKITSAFFFSHVSHDLDISFQLKRSGRMKRRQIVGTLFTF